MRVFVCEKCLLIILIYTGGSIAHLLKLFQPFQEGVIRNYTRQILQGLCYLHEHGIIHRDIKGGNVLVDESGIVKLADFGASTTLSQFGETQQTSTIKGTPYFMAPEVLANSRCVVIEVYVYVYMYVFSKHRREFECI